MDQRSVEQIVRARLAEAFGGIRGVLEAALPTFTFTLTWVAWRDLERSLIASITVAFLALLIRIAQRQTTQFVFNAVIGISIAAIFATRSGEARDAFLPGILYNAAYAVSLVLGIAIKHPFVGYVIGAATNDLWGWRKDPEMLRLASRLTWVLVVPCALRVMVQWPLYQADYVGLLGFAKIAMGWPLQVAALAIMVWMLSRNSTPAEK